MSDVLTGQSSLDDALQATGVSGLSVLTSGASPPDPGLLVASRRMSELLRELGERFDLVVVDTPPALVVGDALSLAPLVDGLIVVVASQRTSRQLLGDLRARLEAAQIRPMGFVLNMMEFKSAGYGHYLKVYKHYESSKAAPPRSS